MIKYRKSVLIPLLAVLVTAGAGTIGQADEIAAAARKIVEANKDAVVTVEMVIEMKMSYGTESDKRETKASAPGVIVDPSGLVVTSLAAVNPSDISSDMEDSEISISSRIVDAKLRMGDGKEVPVDVVLRDRDLDMVFLKPKKAPEQPFKCVDLTNASTPELMDPTITLSRLAPVGNRQISASLDRVSAVVSKPRVCYVISGISGYNLGSPVFTMDGKLVGVAFVRMSSGSEASVSSSSDRFLPVTLPCSTILGAANQAKTAKPEAVEE